MFVKAASPAACLEKQRRISDHSARIKRDSVSTNQHLCCLRVVDRVPQVTTKPILRQPSYRFQCSRFFKEMAGARHEFQPFLPCQLGKGLAVELEHGPIFTSDNKEGRRDHVSQRLPGKVWPATTRNHRCDYIREFRGSNQSS